VIVLAQEEARMLNHNYIGTEHVLLGLIHEGEGVACKALVSMGISLEGVRQQIEQIIGQGQQAPTGHIPFTPRAKKILDLSLREALQLGHNYIGTEHILLGVIREGEGVAAQVMVKLGAELTRVRQRVIQILSGYDPPIKTPVYQRPVRITRIQEAEVPIWLVIPRIHGQLKKQRLTGTGTRVIFVPPGAVAAATWVEAMACATKGEMPRKLADVYPDYCGMTA